MRFEVLGPLRAMAGDGEVPLGTGKRRILLAMLLGNANSAVSAQALLDAMWNGVPALGSAKTLRWHVHQLRQILDSPARISYQDGAYTIRVSAGESDLAEFERNRAKAIAAQQAGDLASAARDFTAALSLWRGNAFEGLEDVLPLRGEMGRLQQLHLETTELSCEVRLRLGDHLGLIGELTQLVEQYPFRERHREQLMLTLYRSGRQADALATYRIGQQRLAEDLGLDPGMELQRLHEAILRNDPSLDVLETAGMGSPIWLAPAELPAPAAEFTGRTADLARLSAELIQDGGETPAIVSITGPPGVGKSALAIRLAHDVAGHFPDGQLYLNLRGVALNAASMAPQQALSRLLRALGGVEDHGPILGVDELSARFRTTTAGRKLLIVLDDARDTAQVRPLLPAAPGCAVIATSRRILSTLDSAVSHPLDVLPDGDALELLGRLVGPQRLDGEREAAEKLAQLCGNTPLAIHISAARLKSRPAWSIGDLAQRLAVEERRLSELVADDVTVRSSFMASYLELADDAGRGEAARMFRLLGRHDGGEISAATAAALADISHALAERLLDTLVDAQLLYTDTPGRFRVHPLLRLFARDLADAEHTADGRRPRRREATVPRAQASRLDPVSLS